MASVQDDRVQVEAMLGSILGTGVPIGRQAQEAMKILDRMKQGAADSETTKSANWEAMGMLFGQIIHPTEASYHSYQLTERMSDAEGMLKDLQDASEKTAEEAAKWCEEYLKNETFCTKVKNFFLPWQKKSTEAQLKSWQEQAKKDHVKTISDVTKGIEDARQKYIYRKIQFDTAVCVFSVAVSTCKIVSDVSALRATRRELERIDDELDDIEGELNRLIDDVNRTVMELSQNTPVSEPLPNLAWRVSSLRQRTMFCIEKLRDKHGQVKRKRDAHSWEALRNVTMCVIKGVESASTGAYVKDFVMATLNYGVPAVYGLMGVGHTTMAAYCNSVLADVEIRLRRGLELQNKLDKRIEALNEWIRRFSAALRRPSEPAASASSGRFADPIMAF